MRARCGIDIGGTGVKTVLIDEDRKILAEDAFDTNSVNGSAAFLKALEDCAKRLKAAAPEAEWVSCGIGCTGPVDIETGIILNPFTLPGLEGFGLTEAVGELLGIPVYIDNDANTAHLGEAAVLENDPGNTALITLGTGVGCSVRIGGKLYRVPGGIHPEIGHTSCGVDSDIRCYCGRTNCMENILSGTAVNRDAFRFFGSTPEEALDACDSPEKKLFRENILCGLSNACETLAGIFDSKVIIIAGGMMAFYEKYFIEQVNRRMKTLVPDFGSAKVIPAKLGKNSGKLGAAVLAMMRDKE